MTTSTAPSRIETTAPPPRTERHGFDWLMTFAIAWLVGGLFVDGWAHNHGRADQSFFTPWHAALYSGFAMAAAGLVAAFTRNLRRGARPRAALPPGYGLALIGVAIFMAGGVADMVWHVLFGIEVSVEALYSPTHLVLAAGGVLIVSGPLRAGLRRRVTGRAGLPMLLSATLLLSVFTFFTQISHPAVEAAPRADPPRAPVDELYSMRLDGSGRTRLTVGPNGGGGHESAWSPDGTRIAFTRFRQGSDGQSDLWLMDAGGGAERRIARGPGWHGCPAWSPDGSRIAFCNNRSGRWQVYVTAASGDGERRIPTGRGEALPGGWSPDGGRLSFYSNREGNWEIYVTGVEGGEPRRLTRSDHDEVGGAWSPSGIAFASNRDGNHEIYVMAADGGVPRRLTRNAAADFAPRWSPDGSQIAFLSERDGDWEVYVMRADGSAQRNVSQSPGTHEGPSGVSSISWSPDGSTLVAASGSLADAVGDEFFPDALAVSAIVVQSALLAGVVLLLLRRGRLPFGSLTLVFGLNMALMSVLNDRYRLIPAAVAAGLASDLLVRMLRPTAARPAALRGVAFAVPALFDSLLFVALATGPGLSWPVHLWAGTPLLGGAAGLLLSYLAVPPRSETEPETTVGP